MKKILTLGIVIFVSFSLVSCSSNQAASDPSGTQSPPPTQVQTSPSNEPSQSPSIKPSPKPTPSPSPSPSIQYYEEGQYKVGSDIPAGEYCLGSTSTLGSYVCVSSDSNGDDILDNQNFDNQYYITVEDGQYFEFTRAICVPIEDVSLNCDPDALAEGMYRVGADIPAGEYKLATDPDFGGYVCVYDNSTVDKDILSNDNFDNNKYVTVEDGQYLYLSRCTAAKAD